MRFVAGRGAVAEAAGRDAVAELLAGGTAAESYRKDVAGRGAVAAEMLLAGRCWPGRLGGNGRDAVADVLLAGTPWRSAL